MWCRVSQTPVCVCTPVFVFKRSVFCWDLTCCSIIQYYTNFSVCLSVLVVFKITYSPKGEQNSDPNRLIRGSNVAYNRWGLYLAYAILTGLLECHSENILKMWCHYPWLRFATVARWNWDEKNCWDMTWRGMSCVWHYSLMRLWGQTTGMFAETEAPQKEWQLTMPTWQ